MVQPSGWQPELEEPPISQWSIGPATQFASAIEATEPDVLQADRNILFVGNREKQSEDVIRPSQSILAIINDMTQLNDQLSDKLYNPAQICLQDPVDLDDPNPTEVLDLSQSTQRIGTTSLQSDTDYQQHLCSCKVSLHDLLDHFGKAAAIANRAEQKHPHDNDALFEYFWQDYYSWLDPAGIRERLQEEADIEHEFAELHVNFAGYMFTFNRAQFWPTFQSLPPDLRRELIEFGVKHPPREAAEIMTKSDFEKQFFNLEPAAFSWQEEYSDEDNDDQLMTLLRMLRRIPDCS